MTRIFGVIDLKKWKLYRVISAIHTFERPRLEKHISKFVTMERVFIQEFLIDDFIFKLLAHELGCPVR